MSHEDDFSDTASDDSFNDADSFNQRQSDEDDDFIDDGGNGNEADDFSNLAITGTGTQSQSRPLASSSSIYQLSESDLSEAKLDYECLTESQLLSLMTRTVADVAAIIDESSAKASMLLRAYHWNKERLIQHYFEDSDKVIKQCGLQYFDSADDFSPTDTDATIECLICDDEFAMSETYSVGDGHRFCHSCWHGYLSSQLTERGSYTALTKCPMSGCSSLTPDAAYQRFQSSADYDKFAMFVLRSYVSDNTSLSWCTGPSCFYCVRSLHRAVLGVECPSGHQFCSQCHDDNHDPCSCAQYSEWSSKNASESENAHWIIANTKRCPQCQIRIEKNQGCNHMVCKNCKNEFCWVCHGDWKEHGQQTGGFYKCNKYDPNNKTAKWKQEEGVTASATAAATNGASNGISAKAASDVEKQRQEAELNRYLFYYQRFDNHSQAATFASQQQLATQEKISALMKLDSSIANIEFQFLALATNAILKCRHTLKYTYVYGYYLTAPTATSTNSVNERQLFEFLQQELEQSVEMLSELTEQSIAKLRQQEEKTKIINYTRVTLKFRHKLLQGLAAGLTHSGSP